MSVSTRAGGAPALRVSIPLGGFNLSGGVKVLVTLANAMAARGWTVTFVAPDFAASSPFPLAPGVRVETIATGPPWLPRAARQLIHYARLALGRAPAEDVCLANYFPTALCAAVARALGRAPADVAYYVQGHEAVSHGLIAEANPLSRRLRAWGARVSYRLPLRFICVSTWVRDRIGRADAVVAHAAALDLRVFAPPARPRDEARVVVGTIGRAGETKGYRYFVDAVARLGHAARVDVLVVSPRRGEVPLPAGVAAEGIEARRETAMAEFYRRCDVFVLPSLVEGFPLPPLEAMACGCAVVVTDCGGPRDYGVDGVNCLMVPPADAAALAAAIDRLCEDAALRSRLAAAGIATATRFERDRMADEFLDTLTASGARAPSRV